MIENHLRMCEVRPHLGARLARVAMPDWNKGRIDDEQTGQKR
jgi:hypothetical protein